MHRLNDSRLLTDIQYADIDDGWNYHRTSQRYYRTSLQCLERAIDHWNEADEISFMMNLGDSIDGQNKTLSAQASTRAMTAITRACAKLSVPVYHCLGNHEYYNFTLDEIHEHLSPPESTSANFYFAFSLPSVPGFEFIVLNCYGLSLLGSSDDNQKNEAKAILEGVNPNVHDFNSSESMSGLEQRFVQYNGGVDAEQLAWLRQTLARSQAQRRKVIVFTHIPVHPESALPSCLCWNFPQVLEILHSSSVVATFSGHSHQNGYVCDKVSGIHHVVLDAVLEQRPPVENAFASIELYREHLVIQGHGSKIPTRVLQFRK